MRAHTSSRQLSDREQRYF